MNYKLVSVMARPPSFLLHWKIFCEVVLSDKYLFYDFDATSPDNFKKTSDFFVILVPFEILSHFHNIDSSHWFIKDV